MSRSRPLRRSKSSNELLGVVGSGTDRTDVVVPTSENQDHRSLTDLEGNRVIPLSIFKCLRREIFLGHPRVQPRQYSEKTCCGFLSYAYGGPSLLRSLSVLQSSSLLSFLSVYMLPPFPSEVSLLRLFQLVVPWEWPLQLHSTLQVRLPSFSDPSLLKHCFAV